MSWRQEGVDPAVAELQAKRFRAMSPSEKLQCADSLYDLAVAAVSAGVRMRSAGLDEAAVATEVKAIFRRAAD